MDPIIKIFILTTLSFLIAMAWTPILLRLLNRFQMGKQIRDEIGSPIFSKLHKGKSGTPTMGGLLVWVTTFALAMFFSGINSVFSDSSLGALDFLTREQTRLPLGALVASAIAGFIDDYFNVRRIGPKGGGLRIRYKILIYTIIAAVGAYWFYYRLDWSQIHIPFFGDAEIGLWYIPIFIFIIVATSFSVNEIDGLDGLAGGTLLSAFAAFGAIAFAQGRFELAAFCGVIAGALLAFLWFNIYPARFFMGDTGAMGLGTTLGIVAMLTNSVLLLPIICLPLVLESGSVILQTISKKLFGKKIFLSTPIHHHFEALGWHESSITMRVWVIAIVSAVIGLIISLVDQGLR
ncbi:MAG TPA: phospho-N-acetylmuramoyl-pentapeptide-transferase [Patescibacteria group bacterium]|nr:phospho-N-acetylmuramoyl-pentapeptide-transferase [Patescibacteria group bacterium]